MKNKDPLKQNQVLYGKKKIFSCFNKNLSADKKDYF